MKGRVRALAAGAAAALLLAPAEGRAALEPTTTTITGATPDPSDIGAPFTVSFTVTSDQDAGVPSGQVHVQTTDGSLCIAQLDKGGGSCVLSSHAAGEASLTAYYEGDGVFDVSSANASHSTRFPNVRISGNPAAQVGVPYVVNIDGTSLSGPITIDYGDGMTDVVDADGGTVMVSHAFQSLPGCYVIVATNGGVSSNPLAVDVVEDDSGAGPTCQGGVAVGAVAAASAVTVDSSVSATVVRSSAGSLLTVGVAVFASSPTGVPPSSAVAFYDVRVMGSTDTDKVDVWFDLPDGAVMWPELTYFDRASGRLVPVNASVTFDSANGRIGVEFDDRTTPRITSLHGTVFAVRPATPDAGSDALEDGPLEATDGPAPIADAPPDTVDETSPVVEASADAANQEDASFVDVEVDRGPLVDVSSVVDSAAPADAAVSDASIRQDADSAPVASRDAAQDRGSPAVDAGGPTSPGAAPEDQGCGCRTASNGRTSTRSIAALLAFAIFARRRRSRATRDR